MNDLNGRSISRDALFERRKQAVRLFQDGVSRIKIAELIGIHRNVVGEWVAEWKNTGKIKFPGKAGRPVGWGKLLTTAQEKKIQQVVIDRAPEQLKMEFALWNRDAIRQLIEEQFSVPIAVRTVGEYLKRWNFTPQKPVRKAYERSPHAVKKWLEEEYPKIKKQAKTKGAEIHWGDETGLRSDDAKGRSYSPCGKTPERLSKGTPEKVNMISSITNLGKLRFKFYKGSFNAAVMIDFLRRLITDSEKKVFLILDNLRVHHCKKVREWVAKRSGQIELFFLPSYSPNQNPDEYLNNDLQKQIGSKAESRSKGSLKNQAFKIMKSIQRQPEKISNYFQAESILYAA